MPTPIVVRHGERELAGLTQPGESWGAAAARIGLREAWAVDLSGEVKVFATDPMPSVALREMTPGDLRSVSRWRYAEHVARWYHGTDEADLDSVTARYGPRLEASGPIRMWVVEVNGRSIGYVQDYRIGDVPGFAAIAPTEPDSVGGDYLIGEIAWAGRGLGTRMLWAWLRTIPGRYPAAREVFCAPDHANLASLRVLDKLGFRRGVWFDEPAPGGGIDTMVACSLDLPRVVGTGSRPGPEGDG
ncbi:MAG: GNAT family N-acetyltransferase [Nocardioides sp.]|uniref:GNAT family N-acetyltransferase n=1 Tax=Nocardioides sp. TaxID=35761 RepID=UPI0039E28DE3